MQVSTNVYVVIGPGKRVKETLFGIDYANDSDCDAKYPRFIKVLHSQEHRL